MEFSPQRDRALNGIPTKPIDYLKNEYSQEVLNAGGLPLLLPNCTYSTTTLANIVQVVDGLLLSGGSDFDPSFYAEQDSGACERIRPERDNFEFELFNRAKEIDGLPILGICRGIQLINAALGGTLYQDISEIDAEIIHRGPPENRSVIHEVHIEDDSKLQSIICAEIIKVNSSHHQAVKDPGAGVKVTAKSDGGLIEAIETINNKFIIGVQWHPESMNDENANKLFQRFINEASAYKEQRAK